MGRQSEYTEQLADQICDLVACGSSVAAAAAELEIGPRTIYQWLNANESFAQKYTRARGNRADARFERIDQVIQDMRDGKVDAAIGRIEIDAIKWQAGHEAPKRYGDRVAIAGVDDAPIKAQLEVVFVGAKQLPAPE